MKKNAKRIMLALSISLALLISALPTAAHASSDKFVKPAKPGTTITTTGIGEGS